MAVLIPANTTVLLAVVAVVAVRAVMAVVRLRQHVQQRRRPPPRLARVRADHRGDRSLLQLQCETFKWLRLRAAWRPIACE